MGPLLLLLALTALTLGAQVVNVNCPAGKFAGNVSVKLTYKADGDTGKYADYPNSGVKYRVDSNVKWSEAADQISDDWCADRNGDSAGTPYCSAACKETGKNIEVLVVIPTKTEGEGDQKKVTIEDNQNGVSISVTNVKSLEINKDDRNSVMTEKEKDWNVVNSISIGYSDGFIKNGGGVIDYYCPDGIYSIYPKVDCYEFGTLSISNITIVSKGAQFLKSTRGIPTLQMNNIYVFDESSMEVTLYPGIYQGSGSPGLETEFEAIGNWDMTAMTFNKQLTVEVYGDVGTMTWRDNNGEKGLVVKVAARRGEDELWTGVESFCPGLCTRPTEDGNKGLGNVGTHTIQDVELNEGSKITISGHVGVIDAKNFKFHASGTSPEVWEVYYDYRTSEYTEEKSDYHVGEATFNNCSIDPDIHFSIHSFKSLSGTVFSNHVETMSYDVGITDTTFNSYVRHAVLNSLSTENSKYLGDTYYDNYDEKPYPNVKLSAIEISKNFVVSADNYGADDGKISLGNITCHHNGDNWEGYSTSGNVSMLMVRHMSDSVSVDGVNHCNIYLKNTTDERSKSKFTIRSGEQFTYTYDNEGNDYNNLTITDGAQYHVSTHIEVNGQNKTHLGYLSFKKLELDQRVNSNYGGEDFGSNRQADSENIHAPEANLISSSRPYGDNYPVEITVSDILIYALYVAEDSGLKNLTGSDDAHCSNYNNNLVHLSALKDITWREGSEYTTDDVNLTITHSEIQKITVEGDSLQSKISDLISYMTILSAAYASTVEIMHLNTTYLEIQTPDSLDLALRHSLIGAGNCGIFGGPESHIELSTVQFTETYELVTAFAQPGPFYILSVSGVILLDHIFVYYGKLRVYSESADIDVIQSFPIDVMTKVELYSVYGRIAASHPEIYYRDLNSTTNFEYESGTPSADLDVEAFDKLGIELLQPTVSDVFAFEIAPSTSSMMSVSNNLDPYVKYSTTLVYSEFGDVNWVYSRNLDISPVYTIDGTQDFTLSGYDYVVFISSINAMQFETFAGYNYESLDMSKGYFVSVRNRSGVDGDVEYGVESYSHSATGGTCSHKGGEHDPFDECHAYIILPTVDMTAIGNTISGIKYNIDSLSVYMKDCASSVINELNITNNSMTYMSNVAANTIHITANYTVGKYFTSRLIERARVNSWLGAVAVNNLTVDRAQGMSEKVSLSAQYELIEASELGLVPSKIVLAPVTGAHYGYQARTITPVEDEPNLKFGCSSVEKESGADAVYQYCASEDLSGQSTITFKEAGGNVNISFGGSETNPSEFMISYATMKSGKTLIGKDDFVIASGDRILIDNHRLSTDLADIFNGGYGLYERDPDKNIGYDPMPTNNNIYIIPSATGKTTFMVVYDTNRDKMLYRLQESSVKDARSSKTHKFNLIEQAQLYLYVPAADGLSVRSASNNVNLVLSDLGVYERIYNTSYLVANVLRANSVHTTEALVYSLQGSGKFFTEIGYVGVNLDRVSAEFILDRKSYSESDGYAYDKDTMPFVMLESGTVNDLGIYTRNYKNITRCADKEEGGLECSLVPVPCKDESCGIVNYEWDPHFKHFWAGKDYNKSKGDNDSLQVRFGYDFLYDIQKRCPSDRTGTGECAINNYNSPIYSMDLKYMSAISIRGQPKITEDFAKTALRNDRYVSPLDTAEPVNVEVMSDMPGWAIGLIVLACVIAAILITMFVLRLLGKESISDFRSTPVGVLGPN